jgi:hypothetical protein
MSRFNTLRCIFALTVLLALPGCVAYVPEGGPGGYVSVPVVVAPSGYYGGYYGGYRGGYGGYGHGWRH